MRAEPKIITAASPAARDPVGLYRFGAIVAATVAASTAAIVLRERPDRKRRVVASVALAASAGVITRGIANPAVAAKRFVEERPLVYAAGLAPVLAAPALSRSFGPAHMTSITGIGFASAMVGKKRGDAISGIAAGWWLGWTLLRAEGIRGIRSNPKRTLDFLVLPLGYVATARLTPVAILAAHELSMLQQKDEAANKEVAGLESYRVELERTSTALRRALIDVLQGPAAPSSSHAVRDLAWRALGRLEERAAVVAAADPDVRPIDELLAGVVAVFQDASTAEGRDSIQLRRIEIDDPRIRGLLGAGLAGALSNARRHQPGVPHEIEIAQPTPDRVRLTVRSTSATRRTSKAGAGLKHLRDQVEDDARGSFSAEPDETGRWTTVIELPTSYYVDVGSTLTAARLAHDFDEGFREAFWLVSVMAFFVAQDGLQTPVKHRRRVRILAGLVTLGFVALERRGHLELPEHGRDTAPQATAAFAAAAGVAAASPWIDNSPWPGWAMVGISRLALRVHPAIAGSLALAHAVAVGYADDKRAGLLSRALTDQVATCLIAPAAVMTVVGTRLPLLRRQEIQLQQGLTRVAQLNELAEDFHAQHSVLDPVEELLVLLRVAPFSSGYGLSLQDAREGITKTAELLPPAHTASDFADQFAAAVAARIYPASIAYDRRDDKLAQLDLRAASKLSFRRPALGVADAMGAALEEVMAPDWLARPDQGIVRLVVTADPSTDAVIVRAWPPSKEGRVSKRVQRLDDALQDAHGKLIEGWDDGRIWVVLPTSPDRVEKPDDDLA